MSAEQTSNNISNAKPETIEKSIVKINAIKLVGSGSKSYRLS